MSSDEPVFKIPAGVTVTAETGECGNCHAIALTSEIIGGLCADCSHAAERAAERDAPRAAEPEAFQLEVGTDELSLRRELRKAVSAAAEPNPKGWLQHAEEQVRAECVKGRHGHEFTIDAILDQLEAKRAPMPPQPVSMRFVMEQAITRGWCEATDRTQTGRRDGETAGKQVRVYVSKL